MPAVPARHRTLAETAWRRAVPAAPPQGNAVHLWRAALAVPETVVEKHYQLLSPQERDRAAAFWRTIWVSRSKTIVGMSNASMIAKSGRADLAAFFSARDLAALLLVGQKRSPAAKAA